MKIVNQKMNLIEKSDTEIKQKQISKNKIMLWGINLISHIIPLFILYENSFFTIGNTFLLIAFYVGLYSFMKINYSYNIMDQKLKKQIVLYIMLFLFFLITGIIIKTY